jgi:hypothetical protein
MKKQTTNTTSQTHDAAVVLGISQDLKNSILIVSVIANLYVLTAWIALQVTTQYDSQLANFLFNR